MDRTQKQILWLLIAIGAIYFIAFIFPNSTGAKTYSMISLFSPDEHIQYPTPLFMLSGGNLKDALHKFILYGDYSYGFPFYGGSALVLLPLKLTNALNSQNVQLAMLLLRQFISVLPMLLAILLMVYTQTKFRSYLTSIVTFDIPAVHLRGGRRMIFGGTPTASRFYLLYLCFSFWIETN